MLAIAIIVCAFLLQKDARRVGISAEVIADLVFWSVLSGIIGSRIFFILLNLQFFAENPKEVIMLQNGGLAWQGGLILGTAATLFFIKLKSLNPAKIADLVAPYLALGQAIGRLGCFLNGCCYGKAVSWGLFFPVHGAHLHPVQLYTSFDLLIIFFILKKYQRLERNSGETFVLYLILASLERFCMEFLRADHVQVWLGLSIFQIVSITIFAAATYVILLIRSRRKK